ncbi:hypothetical protein [Chromatium okenii]|uniref:hypothetical protein n=1 Tax=Chromatium okenii TaxID=61644 RepID=UPI001F5B9052|nr:hypothetical protein [Chromatium okenii]
MNAIPAALRPAAGATLARAFRQRVRQFAAGILSECSNDTGCTDSPIRSPSAAASRRKLRVESARREPLSISSSVRILIQRDEVIRGVLVVTLAEFRAVRD